MPPRPFIFALCLLAFPTGSPPALAQAVRFQFDRSVPVVGAGVSDTLRNAWAGGLNAAQYATLHLDADALEDLVVFDRATGKISTFVAATGAEGYYWRHTPGYETQFPAVRHWMQLADYDRDGLKDMFTYTPFGVQVLRNTSAGGRLRWTTATDLLQTEGSSGKVNLSVLPTDLPAITDLDRDGDLDILSGDATGHRVFYYRNYSMEKTGGPGQLDFHTMSRCWGGFESGEACGSHRLDIDCGDSGHTHPGGRVKHAGSTVLALDLDGNGVQDLLHATVSCAGAARLANGGTAANARVTAAQAAFPEAQPVAFLFPGMFYEDVDFDGRKDLVASPNVSANEGDLYDFSRSGVLYKNTGTTAAPQFAHVTDAFLQGDMIDAGEMSFPALADYDADGDLDLFVGHAGTPAGGSLRGTLHLYENTGTAAKAAFRFVTNDFAGFGALGVSGLKPFFMDWNRDGASDLVLMHTQGTQTRLQWFRNRASSGQPFQISTTAGDIAMPGLRADFVPAFYDMDADGDWDMLLGKNFGELEYHRNTGSNAAPAFVRVKAAAGGLPLATTDRHMAPLLADWNADGRPDLLAVYRNPSEPPYAGRMVVVEDILNHLDGPATAQADLVLDESRNQYAPMPLAHYSTAAAGDLNADGLPDLVLGGSGGGVTLLRNTSLTTDMPVAEVRLGPNPTSGGVVYLTAGQDGEAAFFTLLGTRLMARLTLKANRPASVDVAAWASGLYVVSIRTTGGTVVRRLVVAR